MEIEIPVVVGNVGLLAMHYAYWFFFAHVQQPADFASCAGGGR